jgi:peptidoglycan/xylan/chitin deacetylase (PgdA/CDA1 family)
MKLGARLLQAGTRAVCDLADRTASPRVSVLIFHRVHAEPDPLFPQEMTASRFDAMCRSLKSTFNVMTLGRASQLMHAGELPSRALVITFDDGYADNAEVALPILLKHGLEATFFIATGFLDGGRMFNDTVIECIRGATLDSIDLGDFDMGRRELRTLAERRRVIDELLPRLKHLQLDARQTALRALLDRTGQPALPTDLMMRSDQVQVVSKAGIEIGGHTVNHPILHVLSDAEAEREIAQGRQQLERLTGRPVEYFAYPNGRPGQDYGARDVELVRRLGFKGAVSTASGVASAQSDPFQLPRFTPWDTSPARWLARLALRRVRSAPASVV